MSDPQVKKAPERLVSLDAYRGFVMLAMASAGLGIPQVATNFPGHQVWHGLQFQLDHVPWVGCSFWDLIQPSFMFIVGVAMPFSYANRKAQGQQWSRLFAHAVVRSLILIVLGIFLSSASNRSTNFTFVNVLTQIGLGYWFVFLLLGRSPKVQFAAGMAILVGYWLLFALYPAAAPEAYQSDNGLPVNWQHLTGFAAHWEKNMNAASAFDVWFLNLFHRPDGKPFKYNEGGYATLNFIPSIVTMLFGVLAGELLSKPWPKVSKLKTLLIVGALGIALGTLLDGTVCPVVKRIWTPSWVIFSAGLTCWMLAGFYLVIDMAGWRRWSFPLVVVGANSIAMYVMAQLLKPFVASSLKTHLGWVWEKLAGSQAIDRMVQGTVKIHLGTPLFGGVYGPIYQAAAVLFVLWLICLWMYRQRIFIKI